MQKPIFDGLGLIDKIVVPHANWSWRQGFVDGMRELHGDDLLLLRDDDAFISDVEG